ncbi:uroplakin-2 [Ornithorhynchus anatinus]|uniref:Uroplakin 2 n=1 Tax=Ornithorhynchus anatinus TaxID=9258 RepID=A0A6I8N7N9_ORNAN|nr:uroplakin-2 [Ornithorhynchus anatinus]
MTLPLILRLPALPLVLLLAKGPAEFNISSLSGLLTPTLAESLLVALPPCHLTGGNATLKVQGVNGSSVLQQRFVVPPCRGRRELVSVVDSSAGFATTRLNAYQITGLRPATTYVLSYVVQKGSVQEASNKVRMTTLSRQKAELLVVGMARTGGMVVITVLLSVAMFLLLLGFIVALVLGSHD